MVEQHTRERRRRSPWPRSARRSSRPTSSASSRPPSDGRTISAFREKPKDAKPLADAPDQVYASMGNYVFTHGGADRRGHADAENEDSKHDIGGDLIPMLVARGEAEVYDFADNDVPGATERDRSYWRDVGTLDAYYDAHMDLTSVDPVFNLYNHEWPIHTWPDPLPPAKFVFDDEDRRGHAVDSRDLRRAWSSPAPSRGAPSSRRACTCTRASEVEDSILMHGVDIGRKAVVRRAIVDKNVTIAPGAQVGVDPEKDKERFTVSAGGIVVIPKGARVEA